MKVFAQSKFELEAMIKKQRDDSKSQRGLHPSSMQIQNHNSNISELRLKRLDKKV